MNRLVCLSPEEERARINERQRLNYRLRRAGRPDARKHKAKTPLDVFHPLVAPEPSTGCWIWFGAIQYPGYGVIRGLRADSPTKGTLAHRAFYEAACGPVPTGLVLDHICRVRSCVNPSHLRAVTQKENVMAGEGFAAKFAKRTHCPKGHPFSGDNLFVRSMKIKGRAYSFRICRECQNERFRHLYRIKRFRLQTQKLFGDEVIVL